MKQHLDSDAFAILVELLQASFAYKVRNRPRPHVRRGRHLDLHPLEEGAELCIFGLGQVLQVTDIPAPEELHHGVDEMSRCVAGNMVSGNSMHLYTELELTSLHWRRQY